MMRSGSESSAKGAAGFADGDVWAGGAGVAGAAVEEVGPGHDREGAVDS